MLVGHRIDLAFLLDDTFALKLLLCKFREGLARRGLGLVLSFLDIVALDLDERLLLVVLFLGHLSFHLLVHL